MQKAPLLVPIFAALGIAACGGGKAAHKSAPGPMLTGSGGGVGSIGTKVASSCSEERKTPTRKQSDVDGDGRPDLFKYYNEIDDPERPGERKTILVRQDIDLNWDGQLDLCRFFDAEGNVDRAEYDLDYDGKIDEIRTYAKGQITLAERDRNNDGRFDIIRRYKGGRLVQKETDTNDDGKIDRWEYFDGLKIERIGVDVDRDGKVDRWAKSAK